MSKWKVGVLLILLGISFFSLALFFCVYTKTEAESTSTVLSNSYLEKFDISNVPYDILLEKLNDINNNVINNEITLNVNNNYYTYSLNDLGISLNTESLYKTIISYKNPKSSDHI